MSTSSNKQQKKGKDGMGNAGKRKEMVKDRRVQQMYVEGKCVKGVCMCVIESCVTMRAYVRACVYVCVVWPPASDTSVRNKQTCYPSMRNIFHARAHLFFRRCRSRYQNCLTCTASLATATRDFRTRFVQISLQSCFPKCFIHA